MNRRPKVEDACVTKWSKEMKLSEAKKLMIETMRERESVHYVLGWLTNSYYAPQEDNTEAYVVVKTLKHYGIDIDIEGVV